MRITGPSRPTSAPTRAAAQGAPGSSFAVTPQPGEAGGPARTAAAPPMAGLDAILALQAVEDRGGGRRQSLRRGRRVLDQLDEIKVALLEGRVPVELLDRLVASIGTRIDSGDRELEAVMDEIELRARVELAKLGHAVD